MCAKVPRLYMPHLLTLKNEVTGNIHLYHGKRDFYADEVWFLFHECTVAKFLAPDWRDTDDSAGWSASTTALCRSRQRGPPTITYCPLARS
jgi:hypothetical protein